MSARLIQAQEEDRRRIARELHDAFGQRLAAMAIDVGLIRSEPAAAAVAERLAGHQVELLKLSDDVRQLSHELHPATLAHLGLAGALRALCRELGGQDEIRVEFGLETAATDISSQAALCLYRVAQEALHNVARHAAAAEARVTLRGNRRHIELEIADSGIGFALGKTRESCGLGIVSMQERVRRLGGTFEIRSESGVGTRVKARVSA